MSLSKKYINKYISDHRLQAEFLIDPCHFYAHSQFGFFCLLEPALLSVSSLNYSYSRFGFLVVFPPCAVVVGTNLPFNCWLQRGIEGTVTHSQEKLVKSVSSLSCASGPEPKQDCSENETGRRTLQSGFFFFV